MKNVSVLCEDASVFSVYCAQNGFFPTRITDDPIKMRECLPFMESDTDEILLVVHGLTDFQLVSVLSFVRDVLELKTKIPVIVVSDIELESLAISYFMYSGDLFYGTMRYVSREKNPVFEPVAECANLLHKETAQQKAKQSKKVGVQVEKVNPIMQRALDLLTPENMTDNPRGADDVMVLLREHVIKEPDPVLLDRENRVRQKIVDLDILGMLEEKKSLL